MLTRRLLLGTLGALPLTRLSHAQAAHRITVLHINDFHSRHEPVDARALTCAAGEACFGGSARLATAIQQERAAAEAEGRAVLLLDAGDQFQGSLFFTAHRGMAELAVQHAIGVDAMTVGNHEFDAGPAVLGRYIDAARFPVLAANVDAGAEPTLVGRIRRSALFERAGLRIGVVGVTTPEALTTSSPGPRVLITDPVADLRTEAAALRQAGATLVIGLTHVGVPADLGLAGVPVIVGGHSHTLLSNTERGALGPAPTVSPGGSLIVQAGAYGRYVGRLDLDVGADGAILAYAGACRHVGLDTPEDPAVAALVAQFAAPLQSVRAMQIGTLPEPLDITLCRLGPCAFGTLVAEAMLRAAHGADLAIMNAGGLRTGLRAGPITLGDVLDAQPFANTLATLDLSGADVLRALEHGLSQTGRGGYAHLAGVQVRQTDGQLRATFADGSPILPDRTYRVATNNFLLAGGDGYTMLRDGARNAYAAGPGIAEITADAIAHPAAP